MKGRATGNITWLERALTKCSCTCWRGERDLSYLAQKTRAQAANQTGASFLTLFSRLSFVQTGVFLETPRVVSVDIVTAFASVLPQLKSEESVNEKCRVVEEVFGARP